jgi:hypothetical protein
MTGAIAVVMAALGADRAGADEDSRAGMLKRVSRHDVSHTAELIEATARRHGFAVFVKALRPALRDQQVVQALVLVLESPQGGTPVMMQGDGDDARSELPLRLEVQPRRDGASDVLMPSLARTGFEFPERLAAELAELEAVVHAALV